MAYKVVTGYFCFKRGFYNIVCHGKRFDSDKIPSRQEREERVLDLHFNQNKNYRQLAQEMKISLRDIGEIVNRAKQEKERQEHKSTVVKTYELLHKGKTPPEVAIILNVGEALKSVDQNRYNEVEEFS